MAAMAAVLQGFKRMLVVDESALDGAMVGALHDRGVELVMADDKSLVGLLPTLFHMEEQQQEERMEEDDDEDDSMEQEEEDDDEE